MMIRTVAIRHVAFEDLGIIEPLLIALGSEICYLDAWNLDEQRVEAADLAVFLGGPISVNDADDYPFMSQEIALAKARMNAERPTLGICLGAQVMARAIGGSVGRGPAREIGWAPVSLTAAGRDCVLAELEGAPVLHWHGENCTLPPALEPLARTPGCPVQAFAPGPRALALQFHAEAARESIEPWLVGHTNEISTTPSVTVSALRADTARHGPTLRRAASAMFERWLTGAGVGR